jgi:hypothetical protein
MPTGYTAKLIEHEQTFEEFALTCARAFGALISMRDDSPDAPIPKEFTPSPWHENALQEATKELSRLKKLTADEQEAFGKKRQNADIRSAERGLTDDRRQNARIDRMVKFVQTWTPPTKDHEGLKKFMLEQLAISRNDTDWAEKNLARAVARNPLEYYAEALEISAREIAYHAKELQEDRKRADGNTTWVKQLRDSLKGTPA